MAFSQWPRIAYFKTIDTAETPGLAIFSVASAMEIKHVRCRLLFHGTLGGTEQIRLNLLPADGADTALASTEWVDPQTITGISQYWLGAVRFDFATQVPLAASRDYALQIETQNYTRNADTFYIAAALDWPIRVNTASPTNAPAGMVELYGYR